MRNKQLPKRNSLMLISYLRNFYGVGFGRANLVCGHYGYVAALTRVDQVPYATLLDLKKELEKTYLIDRLLKRRILMYFRLTLKQGTFKARRFLLGLPVNGQQSRTNGQTAKRLHLERTAKIGKAV